MTREFRLIEGDTFRLNAADGTIVRIQMAGADGIEMTAASGEVAWPNIARGTWYVTSKAGVAANWRRVGILYVAGIVDDVREKLTMEIKELDKQVLAIESIQHGVTDPGGISVQRVQLGQLRMQRARAELRLRDYNRKMSGLPALTLT